MCATSTSGSRFWPGWRSCLETSSRVPAFLQLHMDFDGSSPNESSLQKSTGQPSPSACAAEDRDASSGPSRERPTTGAAPPIPRSRNPQRASIPFSICASRRPPHVILIKSLSHDQTTSHNGLSSEPSHSPAARLRTCQAKPAKKKFGAVSEISCLDFMQTNDDNFVPLPQPAASPWLESAFQKPAPFVCG
jgi:hypothetical protein